MLVGIAAAQLAGQDFMAGLDRHRADAAGQVLTPVPGLASTTAAGLARKFTDRQWAAVETGLGDVHAAALQVLARVTPDRAAGLCESETIDLDTTDVEVYDRQKQAWRSITRANGSGAPTSRPGRRRRPCWPRT